MLCMSVSVVMRLLPRSRILHPGFPLAGPVDQLAPIRTPMLGPKPRDAPFDLVLDLHSCVGLAHEAVSEQVNAVSYMARRGHEREVVGDKPSTFDGGVINGPVTAPNPVLQSGQLPPKCQRGNLRGSFTRQWSW